MFWIVSPLVYAYNNSDQIPCLSQPQPLGRTRNALNQKESALALRLWLSIQCLLTTCSDEEKLSLSQQLNYPEPLWLTAHLPDPEPAEFSAFTRCATAQSPLPCELPSKARDKSHPAVEIGDHHDGCSVRAVGLAEVSKTPSDQTSSGGETKGKLMHRHRG